MGKIMYPQLNRFLKVNKTQIEKIKRKTVISFILIIILSFIPLFKYPYSEYENNFIPMILLFASELGVFGIFVSKDEFCIVLSLLYYFYFISLIISIYFFLARKKIRLSKKIKNYKNILLLINFLLLISSISFILFFVQFTELTLIQNSFVSVIFIIIISLLINTIISVFKLENI